MCPESQVAGARGYCWWHRRCMFRKRFWWSPAVRRIEDGKVSSFAGSCVMWFF
uniref:Uncharacterized protein n=1 Tax=Triticum urartu TaxID=4572 RepID=A0A8R7NVZ6_TRIUA